MRWRGEGGLEKVRLLLVRMKSRKKEGYAGGSDIRSKEKGRG